MRIVSRRCLGLDLHKKQITAHLRVHMRIDREPTRVDRRFGTMPAELDQLRAWVIEQKVTDVVMESTSVYWVPVHDLLEDITKVAVVNASHVKKVPGRKTDVQDAQWLADLHAHGLLRASYVPPRDIRELRGLTRHRTKLVAQRTMAKNRTIKVLETAGVKLSSVVSDVFGQTGRGIIDALAEGSPVHVAKLARGTLREKVPELTAALARKLTDAQRELLSLQLRNHDSICAQIAEVDLKLEPRKEPFKSILERLDGIPGVNELAALALIAELGVDMNAYRDEGHLSALCGLAPGNSITSDKRKAVRTRKGNRYVKRICVQIAWAAKNTKDTFFRSYFGRKSHQIGRNKAIVALAHKILIVVYHMLRTGEPFHDLGPTHYEQTLTRRRNNSDIKRLRGLGFTVIEPTDNKSSTGS